MSYLTKATFGMEVEYNHSKHRDFQRALDAGRLRWLRDHGRENHVIYERGTSATTLFRFLRRQCFLTEVLGFEHDQGARDRNAGSFHFHVRPMVGRAQIDKRYVAQVLAFASHMSRTGEQWRDIVRTRAFISMGDDHARIVRDSKSHWVCQNTSVDTIEVRLNESPAFYIGTLLLPLLMDERITGIDLPSLKRINNNCVKARRPQTLERDLRERVNVNELLDQAAQHYAAHYGMFVKTRRKAAHTLPLRILGAVRDGASHKELHREVVLPTFKGTRIFENMLSNVFEDTNRPARTQDDEA